MARPGREVEIRDERDEKISKTFFPPKSVRKKKSHFPKLNGNCRWRVDLDATGVELFGTQVLPCTASFHQVPLLTYVSARSCQRAAKPCNQPEGQPGNQILTQHTSSRAVAEAAVEPRPSQPAITAIVRNPLFAASPSVPDPLFNFFFRLLRLRRQLNRQDAFRALVRQQHSPCCPRPDDSSLSITHSSQLHPSRAPTFPSSFIMSV